MSEDVELYRWRSGAGTPHRIVQRGDALVLQYQAGAKGSMWLDPGPNAHGIVAVMAAEMLRLNNRDGEVYLVGTYRVGESAWDRPVWEVVGIFTSIEKADGAATDRHMFIWPTTLDTIAPNDPEDMPGAYYPRKVDP